MQFEPPVIMGILNVTGDSFYKGYLGESTENILHEVSGMVSAGADIIDIGGQSTRPGSERVSAEEEMRRVLPVIHAVHRQFPDIIISVDTYYSEVAEKSIAEGACMINDISGGNLDENMLNTAAQLKTPYICMHMKGTPETMQQNPGYSNILTEIMDFFSNKIKQCLDAGIKDIILDPGFGFGKTVEQNFYLLKNLSVFRILNKPVLAGLSRKSTVYKTLKNTAEEALNGSTVLHTIALMNGANILRVHDVKEAKEAALLITEYKNAAP